VGVNKKTVRKTATTSSLLMSIRKLLEWETAWAAKRLRKHLLRNASFDERGKKNKTRANKVRVASTSIAIKGGNPK